MATTHQTREDDMRTHTRRNDFVSTQILSNMTLDDGTEIATAYIRQSGWCGIVHTMRGFYRSPNADTWRTMEPIEVHDMIWRDAKEMITAQTLRMVRMDDGEVTHLDPTTFGK